MAKCNDNRKRRLKRAKKERRRFVQRLARDMYLAADLAQVTDYTAIVVLLREWCQSAVRVVSYMVDSIREVLPYFARIIRDFANVVFVAPEPWPDANTPTIEISALRQLYEAPGDGACQVRFTSEGGFHENS